MKKILIFISFYLFFLGNINAQIESLYKTDGSLRIDSSFHLSSNGFEIFNKYYNSIIPSLYSSTIYPEILRENALEGIVIASIIVNSDGTSSDLKIEKSSNDAFNSEVLKNLKNFTPTICNLLNPKSGKEKYYFPFVFKLKPDNWEELMKENKAITIESKFTIKQYKTIKE